MRKKLTAAALVLVMVLSMVPAAFAAEGTAKAATQNVEVDGQKVEFQMYALKEAGGSTNYVKLRDIAYVLNGTKAQFSVDYDAARKSIALTTGQPYQATGVEMTTPFSGNRSYKGGTLSLLVDGKPVELLAITLKDDAGGAYNYFKLRDLGTALGFKVDWTADRGVIVETGGSTQPTKPTQSTQPANPLDLFQGAWKGSYQSADGKTVSEEIIFTGDQFERAGKVDGAYFYNKGSFLVQTNVLNSYDGVTYPYVLTITAKEALKSDKTIQPDESTAYYYVNSIDSDAGQINWYFGTYNRMNPDDPNSSYAVVQSILEGGQSNPGTSVVTDIDPMNYAYTAMKYLYDHLKFPSTMDIISVRCGQHISSHIFEKTDAVYVVTITYKAANSLGALVTDTYVTMFNLTTGKTIYDAVGYTKSMIDNSWGAGKYAAYSKNTEALGLSGGGTLSTELTREQVQSLVSQIKK